MENDLVNNQEEFYIGLTMAGAVSAGCYTSGVMDYLFEILDLWENAKKGKLPEGWDETMLKYIPHHKVIIDVMGGASAGGMTTIMSAIYALKGEIKPVKEADIKEESTGNLFYDNWVLMGDEKNKKPKLIEKVLDTSDLSKKIPSLLNSKFIDSICDNAFTDDVGDKKKKPDYVSDRLEILLSQTMLRSVPLCINFSTPFGNVRKVNESPTHSTFEHFVISHFKLDYDESTHKDFYFPLDPFLKKENIDRLKLATKATGAFPIGLSFREFFNDEFSSEYIKNNSRKIVFEKMNPGAIPTKPEFNWGTGFPNPFQFIGVDGGAINNEPFGEVLSILKERHGEKKQNEYDKYALIMIDPFPDNSLYDSEYKQPDDIFSVVPAIIGTLHDQAKVKRREMLDLYGNDYFRGEIYPRRYYKDENTGKFLPEENPIACGSVFAFGGFLDINFRHHDFFLGRDNARNFFRIYFSFEYNPEENKIHPIHAKWSKEMVDKFKFKRDGRTFLPIVPDLHGLKDKIEKNRRNPYERTVKEWPIYKADDLFALAPKIEERVKKMLDLTVGKLEKSSVAVGHPITQKWMDKYYREGFFKRISGWLGTKVLGLIFLTNKGKVATKLTKATIMWILKDLEDKKLIQ